MVESGKTLRESGEGSHSQQPLSLSLSLIDGFNRNCTLSTKQRFYGFAICLAAGLTCTLKRRKTSDNSKIVYCYWKDLERCFRARTRKRWRWHARTSYWLVHISTSSCALLDTSICIDLQF
ncbi:PREDICTED: uncharacterized protein LOC101299449 [Fragaria vesca subsp. vesca]